MRPLPSRSDASAARVRGPSAAAEPLEVGDRVDVIDQIRRVDQRATAPSAAKRAALPGP